MLQISRSLALSTWLEHSAQVFANVVISLKDWCSTYTHQNVHIHTHRTQHTHTPHVHIHKTIIHFCNWKVNFPQVDTDAPSNLLTDLGPWAAHIMIFCAVNTDPDVIICIEVCVIICITSYHDTVHYIKNVQASVNMIIDTCIDKSKCH